MSKKLLLGALLVSLCLSFALYGNTIPGEFVWDDAFFLIRPELGEASHLPKLWTEAVLPDSQSASLYRPFTMFTFALNLIAHGKSTMGFHLVSIVLNALVVWLVFVLVNTLFKNKTYAVFTALFFGLLPIHTEAIALMKARDELLGALFALLAWLAFIKAMAAKAGSTKWLALSALLFFVGMLSKEFVVVTPALFLFVYWVQQGSPPIRRLFTTAGWMFLFYGFFFALYLWMRSIAIPETAFGDDEIGPLSNILVAAPWWPGGVFTPLKILYIYIAKIFVPIGLTASYHFKAITLTLNIFYSWRALLGLGFLAGLIWLVVWKKTRATALGIGAATFLILYMPVSQVFLRGGDIMGERWMYLPSLGLAMIAGWCFVYLYERSREIAIVAMGCIVVWYGATTMTRNVVWRTPLSLFESMVRDSPTSVRGYSALAQYYFEQGQFKRSRELIEQGLRISNQEPNLYVIAASIAYKQQEYALAETFLRKALALPTFSSSAIINFPRILFAQGKYEEALLWFDEYVSELPATLIKLQERVLYASILTKLGKHELALLYIANDLADKKEHPDVQKLIAVNLYKTGKTAEALQFIDWDPGITEEKKIEILKNF